MSKQTIEEMLGNQAIINTDRSKLALWNYRTQQGLMNNATYDPVTIPEGTVVGRIAVTGKLKVFTSGASDGSQFPIGVVLGDPTIEDGEDGEITIVDTGDVAGEQLLFQGGDTLNTVVDGRTVFDHLKLIGIKCVSGTDLSNYDNS